MPLILFIHLNLTGKAQVNALLDILLRSNGHSIVSAPFLFSLGVWAGPVSDLPSSFTL